MTKEGEKAISDSSVEDDFPLHFSEWLKRRRLELDLTQEQLAQRASCSVFTIRKIESGERQPPKQLAGLLAQSLEIPTEDQPTFIKVARGEMRLERLGSLSRSPSRDLLPAVNLPKSLTPFNGANKNSWHLARCCAIPNVCCSPSLVPAELEKLAWRSR